MQLKWFPSQTVSGEGILTGCDAEQEWMLKWWWEHYAKDNHYPVSFCDFGMSKSARLWCQTKGNLISLEQPQVAGKSSVTASWSKTTTAFAWSKRQAWFCKPLVLLKTPYQKTIWLDIDCRVKGNLEPLFRYIGAKKHVALAQEIPSRASSEKAAGLVPQEGICYNTGVIAYMHQSPLIKNWALHACFNNHEALGDQDLLSHLLFKHRLKPQVLPSIYNRIHPQPDALDVVIYHHTSLSGKASIRVKNG